MLRKLLEPWLRTARPRRPCKHRPVPLFMESLEDRCMPTFSFWTSVVLQGNWSDPNNWTNGDVPGVTPGVDTAIFSNLSTLSCTVDITAGVTIKNLDIRDNYGGVIFVNNPLTVSGGTANLTSGSAIELLFGVDFNIRNSSTFNWTGGRFEGGTGNVVIDVSSVANISGTADKTLADGTFLINYGEVTWTGAGNIILPPALPTQAAPEILNEGTFIANANSTIDGQGSARNFFINRLFRK